MNMYVRMLQCAVVAWLGSTQFCSMTVEGIENEDETAVRGDGKQAVYTSQTQTRSSDL